MERWTLWAVIADDESGRPASVPGVDAPGHPGYHWQDDRLVPNTSKRTMAALRTYDTFAEAVEAHRLAESRRPRRSVLHRVTRTIPNLNGRASNVYRDERLDYLCVRSTLDTSWNARYPQVPADRWTALLTKEGESVMVVIYGNAYRGTVVKSRLLSADVRFSTRDGARVRPFTILPPYRWDRGIHQA